ncbi:AP-3 complex subunit delta-1 [Cryptotermes secundus]|uniref:AP-3 complex subunit delta-1 n=3 Tax=Cryptotermes secundus TaxID=105785 RepID=A0A2J7QMW7_9NEOP|nr:AP-3 complex subunit delta-1 isoform X1 [Cryptotermes secundus]PNF29931.1 AP-3 complex subunit delta-1 [Cryptotermes secundus]
MALRKVKGNFERMFDKNLTDLVRGIRNNKDSEAKYIAQCIEEIKQELRQDNVAVKANAVAKLTYLQMLGYDISWAGFNIIEVMSSSKFTYKRIGYLSSSQSFHSDTELLMLTTNMIRKDLNSQNQYDAGLALSGLSCFISPDLARDLANDIMTLLTSTKPYLRKKAVLMMYKVFLRFPEALRPAFPRLKEKLEDPDSGVQSAAVNVVCELARKNPKNYLSLAPVFFKLMTTSTNNWMLIKIIKLFGALTPLEPRLGKKLIEPLTNLIHSTSAMSLLYECINTVIAVLISISSGMPNHSASIQLCVQKLRILIEDSDQNLKYLGLLAMSKILKTHPKSVQAHKDLIMQCLDDKDESIRLRALDLLYGMVSKKNLMEIVKKLMVHMDKAEGTTYRDELLSKIIQICSQNNYQYITNFEWYVSVLVELTRMEGSQHGSLVASQMLDVATRVQAIRQFAVQQMALLIDSAHLLTAQSSTMSQVLYAAAWITGEFSQYLTDPQSTLEAMLRGRVFALPGDIQAVYVQNILKLFTNILSHTEEHQDIERINKLCDMIAENLPQFVSSADLEVQERASSALQLVRYLQKQINKGELGVATELTAWFAGELNPVAPKAQKKVQVPEGLDLDMWINDPPSESSEDEDMAGVGGPDIFVKANNLTDGMYGENNHNKELELTEEELEKRRQARRLEQANNPHYLKTSYEHKTNNRFSSTVIDEFAEIPITEIDLPVQLKVPGLTSPDSYLNLDRSSDKRHKKKKRRKGKKGKVATSEEEEEVVAPLHVVNTDIGEMPEGAQVSDGEEPDSRPNDDPHKALDINLDEPLRDEEKLPVLTHRTVESPPTEQPGGKMKKPHHHKDKSRSKDKEKKSKSKSREHHSSKSSRKALDSVDLWLTEDPPDNQPVILESNQNETYSVKNVELKTSREKKRKTKDGKKEKKKGQVKYKEGYEEAAGISTPSKEVVEDTLPDCVTSEVNQLAAVVQQPPLSAYIRLAGDKNLQLMYETRLLPHESDQIVVSIVLKNQSSSVIKELVFSMCDTPAVRLLRANRDDQFGIKMHFQLPARCNSEAQLAFHVTDVTFPHKVRGTVTYMVQIADGSSTHEKLDFWLNLPCSTFMIGRLSHRDTVTDLLSSGQLTKRRSMLLDDVQEEFSQILARICFHCHFILVEQVDKTASLYSRSIQDHHVCLLVKSANSGSDVKVSLEGKSNCDILLANILSEIEVLLHTSKPQESSA